METETNNSTASTESTAGQPGPEAGTPFDSTASTASTATATADSNGTNGPADSWRPPTAPAPAPVKRLYRTDGPLAGIAGGLAEYFNVDPVLVRLGIVAGTLLGGPVVPIGYIAAWFIIPSKDSTPVAPIMTAQPRHPDAPVPSPVSTPVPAPVDDIVVAEK